MVAQEVKSDHQVIRVHSLRNMNICKECHSNPLVDISLWNKVLDLSSVSIPGAKPAAWLNMAPDHCSGFGFNSQKDLSIYYLK